MPTWVTVFVAPSSPCASLIVLISLWRETEWNKEWKHKQPFWHLTVPWPLEARSHDLVSREKAWHDAYDVRRFKKNPVQRMRQPWVMQDPWFSEQWRAQSLCYRLEFFGQKFSRVDIESGGLDSGYLLSSCSTVASKCHVLYCQSRRESDAQFSSHACELYENRSVEMSTQREDCHYLPAMYTVL